MTREDFYAKYGKYVVSFESYYKYSFTFSAPLANGAKIRCDYGGNSDSIYRWHCDTELRVTVEQLQPYSGQVIDSSGTVIDDFYDY